MSVTNSQAARQRPKVSVVLSFFNEANVIAELLARLRRTLNAEGDRIAGYELIFVNDASTDASEKMLRAEIERHGDVVLINMSRNFGVSECVYAGFANATGDVVIYLDADLQDPPEIISEMLKQWRADDEVEVVYTTRKSRAGEGTIKLVGTRLGYHLLKAISNIDLPIESGDYKLLSRRAVDELLKFEEKMPYMRGLVGWIGFKQVRVLYDREPRHDGRRNSKFPFFSRRVLFSFLDRALISFSDAPLKLALFLGFAVAAISSLYLLVVFFQKFMGWYEPGLPALMAAILFLGGVQLTVMGLIGLYINVIFLQTKGRPNYIIKEIVRGDRSTDAPAR
jgi:dolichol-phosphate mannosyltransferase